MSDFEIQIKGLEKLIANLMQFRRQIKLYLAAAGREAANDVLDTQGLRNYPPAGSGNAPPTPYWIRGVGLETKKGNKGNSERYGTQFYVQSAGYNTKIGNRASYARWLTDEKQQAQHMQKIGWRKLIDVARDKGDHIIHIYQSWIDKLVKDLGL